MYIDLYVYINIHTYIVSTCACRDLKESLEQEEEKIRRKKLEGADGPSDSPGPAKEAGREGDKEKGATQRSSLLAMKKAVRNGDMFTEERNMFEEKYLVSVTIIFTCGYA